MNNPPPLPQERPLPLPSINVDIPNGTLRPIISIVAGACLADFLFWNQPPGLSIGIFGLFLGTLVLFSRASLPSNTGHWMGFALFTLSCLQSIRFISLSNLLVISLLLVGLSGYSAYPTINKLWMRWAEGLLSIAKPIGAWFTFRRLTQKNTENSETSLVRLKQLFVIAFPALLLLLIFGALLGSGNAILGKWKTDFLTEVTQYLSSIEFPKFSRLVWWLAISALTLTFVCPPNSGTLSSKLEKPWRQLGMESGTLRRFQWITCLAALNVLFLMSNVTDVIFLWLSRELPAGISHSDYVHQGVYALIATTVLSALIMALLTQHTESISRNRWIRILSYLWMLQNAILISGVYIRLWIYVDAYGYTPKRVYVALFLSLVVLGFGLLGWAIRMHKHLKWLIASNLVLLFCFFSALQFIDVPKWVTTRNIALYTAGKIAYPEDLFFKQVGSHSIPFQISIYRTPRSISDKIAAFKDLESQLFIHHHQTKHDWRGYQRRDQHNYQILEAFFHQAKDT